MNILVVGSGSREHALAWKLSRSSKVKQLFVAPGNPGTAEVALNINIKESDLDGLVNLAVDEQIDLVVVGPEQPLVDGLVDRLTEVNIKTFGPTQAAAAIEGSKAFAKALMSDLSVPTAAYQTFSEIEKARSYIQQQELPIVVKASGLAGGKGAVICQTKAEALDLVEAILVNRQFGDAGNEVVIEEFLVGPEISIHVLSDGQHYIIFPPSQDHKAIGEGNTGPNTGGMGVVAPLPGVSDELMEQIEKEIVAPIIAGMKKAGKPYVGLLYPGIILTKDGPKVLEFNCRFGDPEVQCYMRLLKNDLADLLLACVEQKLDQVSVSWQPETVVNIVIASEGYPGDYTKGVPITGLEAASKLDDVVIFQAGTTRAGTGLISSGGRVLSVTASGDQLDDARTKVYRAIERIQMPGMQYRKDIGTAHDNSKLANF